MNIWFKLYRCIYRIKISRYTDIILERGDLYEWKDYINDKQEVD